MDTNVLVTNRIEDGRKLLSQLARDGFDVKVAFWAKSKENGLWILYVGSPSILPESIGQAYQTLYGSLRKIPEISVSISEIKLIRHDDPAAKAAMAIRDRSPGRIPTQYVGESLGNLLIEEAYIYPKIVGPMTQVEVLQTITALMSRSGFVQPALVTLQDGSVMRAIPISVQVRSAGEIDIGLLDADTNVGRLVNAGEVVNIQ